VLSDKEAKKVFQYGDHHAEGHVDLSKQCWEDPKHRTYGELLGSGDKAAAVVLARDSSGKTRELVRTSDLPKLLVAAGHRFGQQRRPASRPAAPKKPKVDPEEQLREQAGLLVVAQLVAAAEKAGPQKALRLAVREMLVGMGSLGQIAERRGMKGYSWQAFHAMVDRADVSTLCGLVAEIAASEDDQPIYAAYGLDVKKLDKAALEQLKAAAAKASPVTGSSAKRQNAAAAAKKGKPAKKPAGPLARKAKATKAKPGKGKAAA
jgi:hypothetical protein